jgi:RimJ/RimL family protein N-acetyltransferase
MSIEPDYRRHGIAEQLQRAGEQQALRMGKDLIVALISRENIPSLKLANKLGYCEAASRRSFLRTFFLARLNTSAWKGEFLRQAAKPNPF